MAAADRSESNDGAAKPAKRFQYFFSAELEIGRVILHVSDKIFSVQNRLLGNVPQRLLAHDLFTMYP